MTTTTTGNDKYTYGFEVIDSNVNYTLRTTWDAVFNVFRKYDCGYHVTNSGVISANYSLTLEQVMCIYKEMHILLNNPLGKLFVMQKGKFIKQVDLTPKMTNDEIKLAIKDLPVN